MSTPKKAVKTQEEMLAEVTATLPDALAVLNSLHNNVLASVKLLRVRVEKLEEKIAALEKLIAVIEDDG